MINQPKYFSIIGSGLAARFFANYLPLLGLDAAGIWARNPYTKMDIAEQTGLKPLENIKELIRPEVQLILICTPDDAIEDIALKLPVSNAIVAHASGACSIDALGTHHPKKAVLWPMLSLASINYGALKNCPIALEEQGTDACLRESFFARQLSCYEVDSNKRLGLHMAAVLANNFTHHLMYQVSDICEEAKVPLELFQNLAQQALACKTKHDLYKNQTGPARRGDEITLKQHMDFIDNPELKALYEAFTYSIKKTYGTEL